jgi:hypothetical protein
MTDTAFAKLIGRQYTGGEKTREFIRHYQAVDLRSEKSKKLVERAHKTIRRSFQHFRTAMDKLEELAMMLNLNPQLTSSDQARDRVMVLLQAKRHLDKARLYIHPAVYLSRALLSFYRIYWEQWTGAHGEAVDQKVDRFIKVLMEEHGASCAEGPGEPCYWELRGRRFFVRHEPEFDLWDENELTSLETQLEQAEELLTQDPGLRYPELGELELSPLTVVLCRDAEAEYSQRRAATKIKHSVTNAWDRKTTGQKVAFVSGQVLSVGLAAGTGTIGGVVHFPEALEAPADFLVEAASEAVDKIGESGIDAASEVADSYQSAGVATARQGADVQDSLQKAAIHLKELMLVQEKLDGLKERKELDGDDCGSVLVRLVEIYRIKHHLFKTQIYLGEAIEAVHKCTEALDEKIAALKEFHNDMVREIDTFIRATSTTVNSRAYAAPEWQRGEMPW